MSHSTRPALLVASMMVLGSLAVLPSAGAGGRGGSGTPQYFFGLAHQPRGAATLGMDPVGRMMISNIGSSGNDGVSIALSQAAPAGGESPGWSGMVDFGPAGALSPGASIVVQPRDQFDNPIASLHVFETGGGHAGVGAVADMCPTCSVTVQIVLQGEVMRTADFFPPLPPVLATGDIGSQGNDGVTFSIDRRKVFTNQFDVDLSADLTSVTPITLTGGLPPTDGDELRVRLNGLPPGTRYIGNLTITGGNTGPITVNNEGLLKTASTGKVKFFNEAKGFGYITGGGDLDGDEYADIVVSNIGSSGNDGVSLKRFGIGGGTAPDAPLGSVSAECDWGDAGALPTGSSMKFIIGNDAPVVRTYALVVSGIGGGLGAVSAIPCNEPGCCEPCCPCAGVTVEALHHGVVVDRVLHAALPTTVAVGNIGSSGNDGVTFFAALIDSCVNLTDDRYLLGLRCPAAGAMTLTGSSIGAVVADTVRVRITPADAFGSLGVPQLLASSVSQFTILDGGTQPQFHNDMTYAGLPHDALGQAGLGMTPDGRLVVTNIGSSGNDGVAIALGDAHGASIDIDFGEGGALPTGAHLSAGEPANSNNDVNKIVINETAGGMTALSMEQNRCPTCPLQVELLLDGHVVGSAMYPPPYPPQLVTGAIGSSGASHVRIVTDRDSGRSRVHNPVATAMTLSGPGQTPVSADCVRMTITGLPTGLGGGGGGSGGVAGMEIRAGSIREFDTSDESLDVFSNSHRIKDQATFCVEKDALHINNIGSSGNDGVRIDPPDQDCDGLADPAESMGVTYSGLIMPPVCKHAINTKGTGAQGGLVGSPGFDIFLQIEGVGGVAQTITADYTSMGSTSHTVQVFSNGAPVSSQSGVGALVAAISAGHALESVTASRASNHEVVHTFRWTQSGGPMTFTIPGQPPVIGDELRVSNGGASYEVASLSSMSLTGENLGSLTIVGESITPINTCPADVAPSGSPDGAVNVTDLLAVIGGWGACTTCSACPADVNDDCTINVTDLLAVIGAWGACP